MTKLVVYLGAASEHSLELPQQTLQYFALLCIVETFPNLDIKFSKHKLSNFQEWLYILAMSPSTAQHQAWPLSCPLL